jgi:CBS domain-containing protein
MTAGTICSRPVATARPTESVQIAARRMADEGVGTLVVVEHDNPETAIGIVTDRDIVLRAVAKHLSGDMSRVGSIMSTPVHWIAEDASVDEALSRMAIAGTRRLVVTDSHQRLVGVLGLDDVLDLVIREAGTVARLLEGQKPRVPA